MSSRRITAKKSRSKAATRTVDAAARRKSVGRPKSAAQSKSAARAGVPAIIAELKRAGSARVRNEMGPRFGIHTEHAFGVRMAFMHALAKRLGRGHELAASLWATGIYEARLVAAFVEEPERVTPTQMDRWCRDFDNWAVCDTVCFHLFDRTPHAFGRVTAWARRKGEFEKRAAFALLASVALHDKSIDDEMFVRFLPLIERASDDGRNFVKKGVSWALRAIGGKRRGVRAKAIGLAKRLAKSEIPSARWIGKDAVREFTRQR